MKKALIIVDLQNDFMPGGALGVKDGDKILPSVNALLKKKWDLIVASKDWHPKDHVSFAASHNKNPGEKVSLTTGEQILWPIHCVQGSIGAEFHPGWDASHVEKVFQKGVEKEIDSYSAFFDNRHVRSTGLSDFLKEKKIEEVYFAGLTTEYCIRYSALDALDLGFKTYVILDAIKPVNLKPGDDERALVEIQRRGASLVHLKDLKD